MPRIPSSFRNNLIDRVIRELNPGAEDAIFPRTLEENAIFVYPGRPTGMEWRSGQMVSNNFNGAAGVLNVQDTVVATTGLRYYHAISAQHSDPIARDIFIEILSGGQPAVAIATFIGLGQARPVPVGRPIVLGEGAQLQARASAIAGGSFVTLRTYAANQGLGSEMPGL